MIQRASLVVALGFLMVSCSSDTSTAGKKTSASAPDAATVRSAIESANGKFLDALKRADKAALVATYTADAIIMQPNEVAWAGKAEIEKGFGALLEQMTFQDGATRTEDVMLAGDLAVETGIFAWTLKPKSGAVIKEKGKYLTVWKRQADNTWKIVRDINNSDLPLVKGRKAPAGSKTAARARKQR